MDALPEVCPSCKASLVGEPISEDEQKIRNDGETHYTKIISRTIWERDRRVVFECPACSYSLLSRVI